MSSTSSLQDETDSDPVTVVLWNWWIEICSGANSFEWMAVLLLSSSCSCFKLKIKVNKIKLAIKWFTSSCWLEVLLVESFRARLILPPYAHIDSKNILHFCYTWDTQIYRQFRRASKAPGRLYERMQKANSVETFPWYFLLWTRGALNEILLEGKFDSIRRM